MKVASVGGILSLLAMSACGGVVIVGGLEASDAAYPEDARSSEPSPGSEDAAAGSDIEGAAADDPDDAAAPDDADDAASEEVEDADASDDAGPWDGAGDGGISPVRAVCESGVCSGCADPLLNVCCKTDGTCGCNFPGIVCM